MKKYAVAFISFFNMELKLSFIESAGALEAAYKFMDISEKDLCVNLPWGNFSTVEALDDFLCQCEASIQVKEIV